ncbi:unnamed protein product [Nippostrongylus brasiliensis]|uniref:Uncharacterized protein n=1 Tax=Nippostrongylus brasiliensis TaxID=27835 RepID=A0A0N4Y5M5_NIPBR|nr:unnamed protein product [Nippostrongylus brasiliensis]
MGASGPRRPQGRQQLSAARRETQKNGANREVHTPGGTDSHGSVPPLSRVFVVPVSSCRGNGDGSVAGMCDAAAAAAAATATATTAGRPANLGAYIDRLVETLVMNSTGNQQQQQHHQPQQPHPAHHAQLQCSTAMPSVAVKEELAELPLSYNQINCLENVHRLLKSQSRPDTPTKCEQEESASVRTASVPLTREVLQAHTRRWEEQYRDTWHRRLKRMSAEVLPGGPAHKHLRPASSCTPPAHWPIGKREEAYRNFAPNPPPPPGINFQEHNHSVIHMPSEPLVVPREMLHSRLQWAAADPLKQHRRAQRLAVPPESA